MEAIKHTIKIPADKQLHIQLPDYAIADEEAEVIVLLKSPSSGISEKLLAMREAINDPMYLADLNEAMEDFQVADAVEE
jgi:hypothetical protein